MANDVLLMFNGKTLFPHIQHEDNSDKVFSHCYLAECFWIAQFSLLVKNDHLIGMTYWLNDEYFEQVSAWVYQWNSPYLLLKDTEKTQYYHNGYVTQYAIEIYFTLEIPDRYEGLAMIEDRWWYLHDSVRHQHGWYPKCIDSEIAASNLYAIGLSDPDQIAKEYGLVWEGERISLTGAS